MQTICGRGRLHGDGRELVYRRTEQNLKMTENTTNAYGNLTSSINNGDK